MSGEPASGALTAAAERVTFDSLIWISACLALTLLVGIVTNLLTSYWLSHWMFDGVVGRRGAQRATLSI